MDRSERDAVLDLLHDSRTSPEQRLRAAEILLAEGEERAVPLLRAMAADATVPGAVRVDAARLLMRHDDALGRELLRSLALAEDLSPVHRLAAGQLLGDDSVTVGWLSALAADTRLQQQIRGQALALLASRSNGSGGLVQLASEAGDDVWLWTRTLTLLAINDIGAARAFLGKPRLDVARHLWLAEFLRTQGDPAGGTALYEVATDPQVVAAEREAAAHKLLSRPETVSSGQLARLVDCRDLDALFRGTALRTLCRRTTSDAFSLIHEIATDRELEPPYRAWAAWTVSGRVDASERMLMAIASDGEIDCLTRQRALDRIAAETLPGFVVDRDQPEKLRQTALTGLLRRNPPVVAGLLHTLISDESTEQDLRALALRSLLATAPEDRERLVMALAADERIDHSLRPHLRTAAVQPLLSPPQISAKEHLGERPNLEEELSKIWSAPAESTKPPEPPEPFRHSDRRASALWRAQEGDREALDDLFEFLRHTRYPADSRAEAARLLVKRRHPDALRSLRLLVADARIEDPVRAELARLLRGLGDRPGAVAALLAAAPDEGLGEARALIDDDGAPAADRVRAATMLVGAVGESGVPSLVPLLGEPDLPDDVRLAALDALSVRGGQPGMDALGRIIRDADATPEQRLTAAIALFGKHA